LLSAGAAAACVFLGSEMAGRFFGGYVQHVVILMGINMLLAASLNLINGEAGQFSIGHAGFMTIGAYICGGMAVRWRDSLFTGAPENAPAFFLLLLAGGVGAGFSGLIVGLPTLRLRGDYLAIATLGFGEIVRVALLNLNSVGGARGLPGIPPCNTLVATYGVLVVAVAVLRNLSASRFGRALRALREDETAAEAIGINATKYKVAAFVVGAFFAGVAGGLYAHLYTVITPNMSGFMRSVEMVLMVVLGGSGSLTGSLIGAAVLTVLPESLRDLGASLPTYGDLRMVFYSALLIALMLARREGLLGTRELSWAVLARLGQKLGLSRGRAS